MTVSKSPSAAAVTGDMLTADERTQLVSMLEIARDHAFPPTLGAPGNRIGESPAQDFYFRRLLDQLLSAAGTCGVAAAIGSIDDVWRFVDDRFDAAKRACGPQTRRCSRETVRQFLAFQWRQHFRKTPRTYTFDERTMDTDPPTGATVTFHFASAGEAHPVVLSADVRGFKRADGSRVDLVLPALLPLPCWLPPLEDRSLPHEKDRLLEQSRVVVRALLRRVDLPTDIAKELRTIAKRTVADADRSESFQAVLRDIRRGTPTAAAVTRLRSILADPDADIREIHRTADELRHAGPAERRAIVERFRTMVKGAIATLFLIFLAAYFVPSPVRAAVQERVRRAFDRIVSTKLFSTLMRSGVDTEHGVFVQPNGVEAPEIRTPTGSSIRLSPGPSQNLLNVRARFADPDIPELRDYVVILGGLDSVGVGALQYRTAPHEPPIPWIAEISVVPLQDRNLAAELASKKATIEISYTPPVAGGGITHSATVTTQERNAQVRLAAFSDLHEFPHSAQTYTITATVRRTSGQQERYTGELRFNDDGFGTFMRERGAPVARVPSTVRAVPPRCVTVMDKAAVMMDPRQANAVMTQALVEKEQTVIFSIGYPTPPPGEQVPAGCTIDYGDGSPAEYARANGVMMLARHSYRVGDRPYTITVYFENSSVTYQFELYVFSNRMRPAAAGTLTYATPYPPNADDAAMIDAASENNPNSLKIKYVFRDPAEYHLETAAPTR